MLSCQSVQNLLSPRKIHVLPVTGFTLPLGKLRGLDPDFCLSGRAASLHPGPHGSILHASVEKAILRGSRPDSSQESTQLACQGHKPLLLTLTLLVVRYSGQSQACSQPTTFYLSDSERVIQSTASVSTLVKWVLNS